MTIYLMEGDDRLTLDNYNNILTVSGSESILGGSFSDVITVDSSFNGGISLGGARGWVVSPTTNNYQTGQTTCKLIIRLTSQGLFT